jgi:predicted Zn-dependent peptidase
MLFEGTKSRPSALQIANEIESIGGDINAFTSNERTCFYTRVLRKHFDKGLDIITDIIQNPLFDEKAVEKERKVILKEIDMVIDEPRFHQWVLFQQTLFKKHPTKNPTYGTIQSIKRMTRNNLIDFYETFYKPNNMVLTIVGNLDKKTTQKIKEKICFSSGNIPKQKQVKEPKQTKPVKKIEKRRTLGSYLVFGYKTPTRTNKDSYVIDVIRSILGRGQSGKIFHEIRNKRGLAYDVGVHYDPAIDYGFIAVHVNTHKKNINKCIKIILNEFKNLKNITEKELKEAKDFLEGEFYLQTEDNFHYADYLGFWQIVRDAKLINEYIPKIKKVTRKDIANVVDKYFRNNYALAIIKQE